MKVICIGDSLTEGDYGIKGKTGIANIHEKNYPYYLGQMIDAEICNFGICGSTSKSWLDLSYDRKFDLSNADVAIVMLGTNGDLGEGFDSGNSSYDAIIKRIKTESPKAAIYICTPPHVTEDSSYSNCGYKKYVVPARIFVRNYAKENNLNLIDLQLCSYFTKDTEYIMQPNDGLHFGEIGYHCLAKYLFENIKEFF